MIRIAIDGPGGAGKSTVAKAIAHDLGIIYVDTGALYRTIGLYMTRNGIDPLDTEAVVSHLNDFTLELKFVDGRQIILLNGEDVGDKIRTPEISMAASNVSKIKEVRAYLLDTQRNIAANNSVIMDGRDIGTVILPNAEVKIFLTASPKARAKRRYDELIAKGQNVSYQQIFDEMVERDKNDSTRDIAPCVQAKDAILLDNSNLNFEQTVSAIKDIISKKKTNNAFYVKVRKYLSGPIRFFQRIHVTGAENVPETGSIMFCANHMAAKDPIMIAASTERQITFVGKKELFSIPFLGWLIRKLGAVPIDRGGANTSAIKTSVEVLKNGGALAIFPQGHRNPGINPKDTQIKNGAALIAYHSKASVIPVCIKTKGFKYHFLGRIDIIFGRVIPYSELGFDKGGKDEYEHATKLIFDEILKLGEFDTPASLTSEEDK